MKEKKEKKRKNSRKTKKKILRENNYESLGLIPEKKSKRRNLSKKSPRRGDRVLDQKGRAGTFVGVDPRGLPRSKWIAFDEYKVQFPYETQCSLFDRCWPDSVYCSK